MKHGFHSEARLETKHLHSHRVIIFIIIMSSDEDIGGVPSMQSSYSAGMKRCEICMEERSPL